MSETIPENVIEAMAKAFEGIPAHPYSIPPEVTENTRAALKAAEALGWKLTPRKPTGVMLQVGGEVDVPYDMIELPIGELDAEKIYASMWDSAPKVP